MYPGKRQGKQTQSNTLSFACNNVHPSGIFPSFCKEIWLIKLRWLQVAGNEIWCSVQQGHLKPTQFKNICVSFNYKEILVLVWKANMRSFEFIFHFTLPICSRKSDLNTFYQKLSTDTKLPSNSKFPLARCFRREEYSQLGEDVFLALKVYKVRIKY